MSVGFFALSGFQLVRAGSGYQYEYGLTDFGVENQNKNVASAVFLSGITTTSTKIAQISIKSFLINAQTGIATLSIDISIDSSLEMLFFSYIWWINSPNLKASPFNTNGGSSLVYEFCGANRMLNNQYYASGLGFVENRGSLINCFGRSCPSSCINLLDCVTQKGIVSNRQCYFCDQGEKFEN